MNMIVGKARVDQFCFRVSAIESCRDTAVAVAQIFSVASRNFRTLVGSTVYLAQNTGCRLMVRLVLSGSVRQGGSEAWTFTLRKLVTWRSLSAKAESCGAKPPSNYVKRSHRYEMRELLCLIFRKYAR